MKASFLSREAVEEFVRRQVRRYLTSQLVKKPAVITRISMWFKEMKDHWILKSVKEVLSTVPFKVELLDYFDPKAAQNDHGHHTIDLQAQIGLMFLC